MDIEAPRGVRAIEKTKIPAKVELFTLDIQGKARQAFRVSLPESYEFEEPEKRVGWARGPFKFGKFPLPEASMIGGTFIADGEKAIEEIEKTYLPFSTSKQIKYALRPYGEDAWYVANYRDEIETVFLPPFLLDIIKTALAHEASINPNIRAIKSAEIDMRLENVDVFKNEKGTVPHPDNGGNMPTSEYIVTFAPTTQHFAGTIRGSMRKGNRSEVSNKPAKDWWNQSRVKKGIQWSSFLPGHMYRLTEEVLHSGPSGIPADAPNVPTKRFFVRVSF